MRIIGNISSRSEKGFEPCTWVLLEIALDVGVELQIMDKFILKHLDYKLKIGVCNSTPEAISIPYT